MLCPVYGHELTPLSCPPPRGSVFVRLRGQLYFRLTSFRYSGNLSGGNTLQNDDCHGREKGLFTARIVFKKHCSEWLIPVSGYVQGYLPIRGFSSRVRTPLRLSVRSSVRS